MKSLTIWLFQTGEPLHIDGVNVRPMRAMNLSNALSQSGHRVVLWSSAFYHQEKRHRSAEEESIKVSKNLEIRLVQSCGYQRNIGVSRLIDHAQLAFNLKRRLKLCEDIPDVAFIGYPPIETAFILTRWLVKRSVPILLDVKDQWPVIFLNALPASLHLFGRMLLWPYYHMAKYAMREATGLSAMANSFLDWGLNFAGRERTKNDRIFPLTSPLGQVSTTELEDARRWWDAHGIFDNGSTNVCFVGSHSSAFDFGPVYEAAKTIFSLSKNCKFVICGDGERLEELCNMMSDLPNVYFPGWIDRPKIEALAERCRASIAPYMDTVDFRMSIPNKIIDALSLGLPILSPLQGEVESLITKYGVGMYYGKDSGKTLYDCIHVLIQDDDLQKKMSNNANNLYFEMFLFEKVYGDLVKHLEKLVDKQ